MFMLLLALSVLPTPISVSDFADKNERSEWVVVNDGVMGGKSQSQLKQKGPNHVQFSGKVSLRNNGGFASIRRIMPQMKIVGATVAKLKVKGDGKNYQFRVKNDQEDRHSYKYTFSTSGDWETISIPLNEMTPTFRGYTPNLPNYQAEFLAQIGILIANKKAESFELAIRKIWLE